MTPGFVTVDIKLPGLPPLARGVLALESATRFEMEDSNPSPTMRCGNGVCNSISESLSPPSSSLKIVPKFVFASPAFYSNVQRYPSACARCSSIILLFASIPSLAIPAFTNRSAKFLIVGFDNACPLFVPPIVGAPFPFPFGPPPSPTAVKLCAKLSP